jgi:hypothetical protein
MTLADYEQEKFERLSELMAEKGVRHEAFELLADFHPARVRAGLAISVLSEAVRRFTRKALELGKWCSGNGGTGQTYWARSLSDGEIHVLGAAIVGSNVDDEGGVA